MQTPFYFRLFGFLLLVFFLGACSKNEDDPESEANREMIDQLDLWGDSLTKKIMIDSLNKSIQGAMFFVDDPVSGLKYLRAFGTSDVSTSRFRSLNTGDLFRIGTMTNTFTTTVFLQLVQNGVLNLEDKLSAFLPDVPNAENITLRQIAGMTSGLYDFTETDSIKTIWAERPLTKLSPQQILDFAMAYPPYFQPGAECRYSLTNSLLMGMIIDKVTDDPLQDHYRNRILEPLTMSNTKFPTNQFMPFYTTYSHGYEYTGSYNTLTDITERYEPSWAWASANLISDLTELQTWLQALVDGTLLTQQIQQERLNMTNWKNDHGIPLQYGLGIMGASGYFGHTGDIQGFRCIAMQRPATGATIIIMMNNGSGSPLLMFAQIANLLTPGLIPLVL